VGATDITDITGIPGVIIGIEVSAERRKIGGLSIAYGLVVNILILASISGQRLYSSIIKTKVIVYLLRSRPA
jgi:hypothetical protein